MFLFGFQKDRCTEKTTGTLIRKRWNGNAWFLRVEYIVDGVKYKVTEQLKYTIIETKKIGNIPVGNSRVATIGNVSEGDSIRVIYNPNKPKHSYLPDNKGLFLT